MRYYSALLEPILNERNDTRLVRSLRSRYKTKNFPSFLRFSAGGVGGADKKWKGIFWFCFAATETPKRVSFNFITFGYSFLHLFAARRGASNSVAQ